MLTRPVKVSVTALTRLLNRQKLGRLHPVIEPEPVFTTGEEDRAQDEAATTEFRDAGLVDHRGRLDDGLLDTLALLGRPSIEFYGWYTSQGSRTIGVVVAGLGDEGVIVTRLADRVHVRSIRNQGLPETLVAQLPQVRPARVDAVNIRHGDLSSADAEDDLLLDARPHVEQDHRTLRKVMALRETGLGELYVAVRDGHDRRTALRDPIKYLDTRAGRVLITVSGDYLSIAPGSAKLIVERLHRAVRDLS